MPSGVQKAVRPQNTGTESRVFARAAVCAACLTVDQSLAILDPGLQQHNLDVERCGYRVGMCTVMVLVCVSKRATCLACAECRLRGGLNG